jgi:hypothetical protein
MRSLKISLLLTNSPNVSNRQANQRGQRPRHAPGTHVADDGFFADAHDVGDRVVTHWSTSEVMLPEDNDLPQNATAVMAAVTARR